jgi:hypothetical protein
MPNPTPDDPATHVENPGEPNVSTPTPTPTPQVAAADPDADDDDDSMLDDMIESVEEVVHWLFRPIFGRKE